MKNIEIKGAKTHNLKDVDLVFPKNKMVTFTGVSGSGKSSLVFDTLYTEAQRQLIDTFSTFARRRLPQLSRPPVDYIKNISPCIVIDQKRLGRSSRSTVGTSTEIYTYLRMLFSRCGRPFIGWSHLFSFNHPEGMCPQCGGIGRRMSVNIEKLLDKSKSIEEGAILHPSYEIGKWYWREIMSTDILPVDVKLEDFSMDEMDLLLWAKDYPIQYEDRGKVYKRKYTGVARKLEQLHIDKDEDQLAEVQLKAFNRLFERTSCHDCNGSRLNKQAREVSLAGGWTLPTLVEMELTELDEVLAKLPTYPEYDHMKEVVVTIVDKIRPILKNLIDIGIGYLSLNRSVATLSGGESQRVKLAKQLNCDLVDLIYILDEPSIGLHARDINHLISILKELKDRGNSVVIVEHDTSIMHASDWIVDVGPKAGVNGGEVLFSGEVDKIKELDTPTAIAMNSTVIDLNTERRKWTESIHVKDANKNNLRNVSVDIPMGILTCLTGVAGSGKSSLMEVFIETLKSSDDTNNYVIIDQKPIGKSSRSNPATYVGIFDIIRKVFAKENGMSPSLFSFNSKGACSECKGKGVIEMELSFMDDVILECKTCNGKRYKEKVLMYKYHGKTITDVLDMSIDEAVQFFGANPISDKSHQNKMLRELNLLAEVGVGYLKLGQSLSTLSGGEAQRIKLASELKKKGNLYIMDEPTTGLHPSDTDRLMGIINKLIDSGNSVLVIEHNLDVIAKADWIIDLGPDGGKDGGYIVAEGTPEEVMNNERSITGMYLAKEVKG